jgi:FtsZ-interacting cell division protein ZipA
LAPVLIVIIVAVVAIVAVAAWLTARNRNADGVDSFRRQIDALSSEARRPVVEQLNKDDGERRDEAGKPAKPGEPDEGGASGGVDG